MNPNLEACPRPVEGREVANIKGHNETPTSYLHHINGAIEQSTVPGSHAQIVASINTHMDCTRATRQRLQVYLGLIAFLLLLLLLSCFDVDNYQIKFV